MMGAADGGEIDGQQKTGVTVGERKREIIQFSMGAVQS